MGIRKGPIDTAHSNLELLLGFLVMPLLPFERALASTVPVEGVDSLELSSCGLGNSGDICVPFVLQTVIVCVITSTIRCLQ